ncbi:MULTISPECIES: hypothetical protein [Streptomyces]
MTSQLIAPAADFVGDYEQGSSEERAWRSLSVAPSEIAVVMGRSPWQTRADLVRRKASDGTRPPMAQPPQRGLGWNKQPQLAQAFAAQHPQYRLATTGYWRNRARPWQRCWPHRVLVPAGHAANTIVGTLTFRTTPAPLDAGGWGPDGSTTVPVHIYDATQWLCDTLGSPVNFVMAYSSHNDENYARGRPSATPRPALCRCRPTG